MEEKEKLTKFEITKCYEEDADYKVLLTNEECSLVIVRVKVYHNVSWDNIKEGEIQFILQTFESAGISRCESRYDLSSFYRQLALGIDWIASYYKNDKNQNC